MGKIDIIVPVYNAEKYLNQCLSSIDNQILTDLNTIAIDDGSTDDSSVQLVSRAFQDSRFIIISKLNEGAGAARNMGLEMATGEFIAFLDSDDFYPDNCTLNYLYESAKTNGTRVAGGTCLVARDGNLEPLHLDYGLSSFDGICEYRVYQYDYMFWCFIYNRNLLNNNAIRFPNYKIYEDPPFYVRAMTAAEYFCMSEKPVYIYRKDKEDKQISDVKCIDWFKGIQDVLTFSRANNFEKLYYLTARRLYDDGSYLVDCNINSAMRMELILRLIQTMSEVDVLWLREKNYELPEPYVPGIMDKLLKEHDAYNILIKNRLINCLIRLRNQKWSVSSFE